MFVARSFLFILFFYCLLQYPMYGLPCWSGRRSIAVVCVLLISFILLVLTKLDRSFILAALYINSSPVMWSHHEMPNTVPRRLWWKTSSMCEIVVVRFHASASQILLLSSLLVQTYSLMVMLMSLLCCFVNSGSCVTHFGDMDSKIWKLSTYSAVWYGVQWSFELRVLLWSDYHHFRLLATDTLFYLFMEFSCHVL